MLKHRLSGLPLMVTAVAAMQLFVALPVRALVPDPVRPAQAPQPGSAGGYFGRGAETVHPADGLVGFDLPAQTPAARTLSQTIVARYSGIQHSKLSNNNGVALSQQSRQASRHEWDGCHIGCLLRRATASILNSLKNVGDVSV